MNQQEELLNRLMVRSILAMAGGLLCDDRPIRCVRVDERGPGASAEMDDIRENHTIASGAWRSWTARERQKDHIIRNMRVITKGVQENVYWTSVDFSRFKI